MTLGELTTEVYAAVDDSRLKGPAHRVRIYVYDPGVEDYVEATGIAIADGHVILQTPA